MPESVVYNTLLYLHILSMTAWVALMSLSATVSRRGGYDARYCFRVVVGESASGLVLLATGVLLAASIGFPVWTHAALGLALVASVLQAVRLVSAYKTASVGDTKPLARNSRWAPHALGLIFLVMLYIMIFKPLA